MSNKDSVEKLHSTLKKVDQKITKAMSFKFLFLKGVIVGLGTAIGATVVLAVGISVVTRLFGPLSILAS